MAFLICIESATPVCSVALFENDQLLSQKEITEGNAHASALTGLIGSCMEEAGIRLNQLDAISVSKGPGSYTGLRVGVATAKGLCYTLNKPLIAVSTLQSLANNFIMQHPHYDGLICPMIDARRMEVYTALYDNDLAELNKPQALIISEQSFNEVLSRHQVTFIGTGAEKTRTQILHPNALFDTTIHCSASGMGILAHNLFMSNTFEDLAYFEPEYLKEFVGTMKKD